MLELPFKLKEKLCKKVSLFLFKIITILSLLKLPILQSNYNFGKYLVKNQLFFGKFKFKLSKKILNMC